jgi:hypothetical protein
MIETTTYIVQFTTLSCSTITVFKEGSPRIAIYPGYNAPYYPTLVKFSAFATAPVGSPIQSLLSA